MPHQSSGGTRRTHLETKNRRQAGRNLVNLTTGLPAALWTRSPVPGHRLSDSLSLDSPPSFTPCSALGIQRGIEPFNTQPLWFWRLGRESCTLLPQSRITLSVVRSVREYSPNTTFQVHLCPASPSGRESIQIGASHTLTTATNTALCLLGSRLLRCWTL